MKRLHFASLCLLAMFTILSSCTLDEDLLGDAIAENEANQEPDPPTDPPGEHEGSLDINTTPCGYNLDSLAANGTLAIDCQLDLQGQTKNLPDNVTLDFNGGEIINGSLIFSGGKIAGNLLNKDLDVSGDVQLIDPVFQFHPERWDLVQGETTSARAQENNFNLENLFVFTRDLGAATFMMDKFDAYFEVSKVTSTTTNQNFYPTQEAVNIPSNFELIMTDNTILRVYPTVGEVAAMLIGISTASNVTVRGGVLYGDRDLRTYSKAYAEHGSHLLNINSGKNIVIDGVKFTMGSIGGLNINSTGFSFNPDYDPTTNVLVKNCVFDKVRMMSIAITDGRDIIVENNTLIDTALPTQNSDGGVVGYAINLEPVRTRNPAGELVEYQRVFDVIIRNNVERGSRIGGVTVSLGQDITLENNDMENKIVYSAASGTRIRNNTFTATAKSTKTPAIICAGYGETVFDNEISGNTITGYGLGIAAYFGGGLKIYDNDFVNNSTALQLKELTSAEIYNNEINSSSHSSRGITFQLTYADAVTIRNNNINVTANHLYFVQLNQGSGESNNNILIDSNNFISPATSVFSGSKGVTFSNNSSNGSVILAEGEKIDILSNNISTSNADGISLILSNLDVVINNNTISHPSNFECIKIGSQTNSAEVDIQDNSCN